MLLVIGLDGADWSILEPWLARGDLPHLADLRARGLWGLLRSTIRPESSIAWVTFATGVNAARHGIFAFTHQQPESYETRLNSTFDIRQPTFWERAGARGKRVAVLNVPMTYPPRPCDGGAIVGGMLTPSLRSDFTYPSHLRQQLLTAVPDYVLNVERTGLSLERFIRETTKAIRARGRAARWLLEHQAWDAVIAVFTDTDRLQHYALHLIDPTHPRHNPAVSAALVPYLLEAYQAIDQAIGELIAAAGPDATVLLLSDHGFAPCARTLFPNTWLEQQGLLTRLPDNQTNNDFWQLLRLRPALRKLKNNLPVLRDWRRPPPPGGHMANIDWTQTQVVYAPSGGLRFNIQGREPCGILSIAQADALAQRLTADLLALTDPATGSAPVTSVHRREELFEGPFLGSAPDLIIEPRRSDPNPARNYTIAGGFGSQPFATSGDLTGNHTLNGIFLAAGPGIQPGVMHGAQLIDVPATIFHALDLVLPAEMEGRVLPLRVRARPAVWGQPEAETLAADPQSVFSPEDEAAVAERLRALGYL